MSPSRTFNADDLTKELTDSEITIGGKVFNPALATPDVRAKQSEIQIRTAKLIRKDRLDVPGSDEQVSDEQLDRRVESLKQLDADIYDQLAVLLRDEADKSPSVAFLREHLDIRIARRLYTWLEEGDEDESGEAPQTPTPAASTS